MDSEVTVFRSADATAQEDAAAIQEMLVDEGVQAVLLDDHAPGVPSGAWEVRVAAADSARAEALIAAHPVEDEFADVDASADLDLVTVFRSAGNTGEMEAQQVKSLLESNGLEAVLVADARLPNLPDEVRVAREHLTQARRLIAEALSAGPAAADEAEAAGEN
jgi:NADH/NAD ratio-sensing transcriptional regulator Rex